MTGGARRWWTGFGVCSSLAGLTFLAEVSDRGWVDNPVAANFVTLGIAVIVGATGIGWAVARQRPQSPSGPILALLGGVLGTSVWRFSIHPGPATVGLAAWLVLPMVALHLGLTHPDGVPTGVERTGLRIAHLAGMAFGCAILLSARDGLPGWFTVPLADEPERREGSAIAFLNDPALARRLYLVWWLVVGGAALLGTAARGRRWRQAPMAARRAERPVASALMAWTVALSAAAIGTAMRSGSGTTDVLADYAAVGLPFLAVAGLAATVGWVELVRPRLGRTRDGVLELRTMDMSGPDRIELHLAEVLGDPTVRLAFEHDGIWIDGHGRAVTLPSTGDASLVTRLTEEGRVVAAIVHDPADSPHAVSLAACLTTAAIEAERASALARSRSETARVAALRLVHAGDIAAQGLTLQLESGPIRSLAELATDLRTDPAALQSAPAALAAVMAEVRMISQGVFPAELAEHGLSVALPGHAHVSHLRYDRATEVTAYLLAADDPTARIDDHGDRLVVTRSAPVPAVASARLTALGGRVSHREGQDTAIASLPLPDRPQP